MTASYAVDSSSFDRTDGYRRWLVLVALYHPAIRHEQFSSFDASTKQVYTGCFKTRADLQQLRDTLTNMQDSNYDIHDTKSISSPGLVVFRGFVQQNIEKMISIAGNANRLRPHCKTHKMPQVIAMQQTSGIHKFKCATLAEAEMLADCGVRDIFLAYNLVGPNIDRAIELVKKFPDLKFCVTADHPTPVELLSRKAESADVEVGVVLDLDTGLQRTGLPIGEDAQNLYELIASCPGIRADGLHWYDGQHHQSDLFERKVAVEEGWQRLILFRDQLLTNGLDVPRVVAGGTGSFPIHAEHGEPKLELSPGTVVFHDAGYRAAFPDLDFTPAALILTRVISCPGSGRLTLDAGTKAVATDPPQEKRLVFPELPDAKIVLQNEEHLVVESKIADQFQPGDHLLGIPWHICPTVALHEKVTVIDDGVPVQQWDVVARNR